MQYNKVESGIKSGTEVNFKLSSNVVGDSIVETNFPHKLFLTIHKFWGLLKLLQIAYQLI